MQLFFVDTVESDHGFLSGDDSRHAVKVLRKQLGDAINLTDGKGTLYTAEITSADKDHCGFKVLRSDRKLKNRNYELHLAIAPTKNIDRFEWFLEKAVEIGIDEITPIFCARSERRKLKPDRCKRIIKAAAKQSLNLHLPKFNEPVNFEEFITIRTDPASRFMAHCDESRERLPLIDHIKNSENKAFLGLVGPEGDFTPDEAAAGEQNGFTFVTLGSSRLRTETAGVYICNALHIIQSVQL